MDRRNATTQDRFGSGLRVRASPQRRRNYIRAKNGCEPPQQTPRTARSEALSCIMPDCHVQPLGTFLTRQQGCWRRTTSVPALYERVIRIGWSISSGTGRDCKGSSRLPSLARLRRSFAQCGISALTAAANSVRELARLWQSSQTTAPPHASQRQAMRSRGARSKRQGRWHAFERWTPSYGFPTLGIGFHFADHKITRA